jgi:hypothetical protein
MKKIKKPAVVINPHTSRSPVANYSTRNVPTRGQPREPRLAGNAKPLAADEAVSRVVPRGK